MPTPYDQFLNDLPPSPAPTLVRLYHAVRNLPYGSIGQRSPADVLRNRRGSCSGKHLLLRDLLRHTGHADAHVLTMFTHFESRLHPHPSFPTELNDLIQQGHIPDYHHYVRARLTPTSPWLNLDATWHDPLTTYGFPVNSTFDGSADTTLASTPLEIFPPVEDLLPEKAARVASLSDADRARRARFFDLVSHWIATTVG